MAQHSGEIDVPIAQSSDTGSVAAATEPVPLDPDQISVPPPPPTTEEQPQDVTAGAWSTTVTPLEEIDQQNTAYQTSSSQKSKDPHPPVPETYDEYRQPSILSMDDEVNLNSRHRHFHEDFEAHPHHHRSPPQPHDEDHRIMDGVALDFEEVKLDNQQHGQLPSSNTIYGKSSMSASKSRTSLEIRSDSISGDARHSTSSPLDQSSSANSLRFWKKSTAPSSSHSDDYTKPVPHSPSEHSLSVDSYDAAKRYPREDIQVLGEQLGTEHSQSHSHTQSPPLRSIHRVAGRYKGRLSKPSSPVTSPHVDHHAWLPDADRRRSGSLKSSVAAPGGVTMMVAGDDGEIQVTEIDDTQYAQRSAHDATDPVQQPAAEALAVPEPKATTNESQEAVNAKLSEQATISPPSPPPETDETDIRSRATPISTTAAAVPSQRPAASGRSAGPLNAPSDAAPTDSDVRQATPAETAARQQASTSSKAGRSAGPVTASEAQDVAPQGLSQPDSATPSLSSASRAGGRSAGPIISEPSPTKTHARKPSNTPSALERHISRTRQSTLPPKARTEDQRHLRDFEAIMREYKAAEAKRHKDEEEKQRFKEVQLREATKIWEDKILKDWKVARSNPRLRDTWWKGAPPSLRGRVWQLAIGNMQMLPRNLCATTKSRVSELKVAGKWPPNNALQDAGAAAQDVDAAISEDMERTLPSLKLFQAQGPMYEDLKDLLECLMVLRSDQAEEISRNRNRDETNAGGTSRTVSASKTPSNAPQLYVPGLSLLSAMLLLNLSQSEAMIALLNLIHSKIWLRGIYSMDSKILKESDAFERVLSTFLADQLPKVYANMQASDVRPATYAREWVRTLFVPLLPLEVVSRLWDNIILEEGDSLIFRTCLALVSLLSSRLYISDGLELTSILQGKNRAALSVWYRSLQSAPAKDHASVQAVASLPNSPLSPHSNKVLEGGTVALPPALDEQAARIAADGGQKSEQAAAPTIVAREQALSSPGNGTTEQGGSSSAAKTESNSSSSASLTSDPVDPGPSAPEPPVRTSSRVHEEGHTLQIAPSSSSSAIEAPASWVPRDSLFSIYGLDEEKLFSTLEEQVGVDGWWRQSTMDRLIDRELGG